MKIQSLKKFLTSFLVVTTLMIVSQKTFAICSAGSSGKASATIYKISIDANKLITYGAKVGAISKIATLNSDCTSYTTYTITGSSLLPYADGTILNVLYGASITVVKGSINGTFKLPGFNSGINTDQIRLVLASNPTLVIMAVKQPWR